jgi:membrane-associated protease RseP (regulator of RpoE activity)
MNSKNMKTKLIVIIAAIAFLPVAGFAQAPPNPPNPPNPPGPPSGSTPWERPVKKVPVTFLGLETSEVPSVVSEQLGLAKGFGLVVDYVVPDGPAAAAGVQQNDIIKMLNDQILTEPDQLAKLVRSYSEGTNVTLTLLRKGKEQKVTAKLVKKEVPQRPEFGPGHHRHSGSPFGDQDFGMNDVREQMQDLKERLGDQTRGVIHDAVMKAREEAMRAREQVKRAGNQIRILSKDQAALRATKIDIGKAQIVFSDDKGEMKLEIVDGKKMLTAKDPQGKLLFSGPVETKEDLDKIPAGVRQRYDKLQENELPEVAPPSDLNEENGSADENDNENEIEGSLEQVSATAVAHHVDLVS